MNRSEYEWNAARNTRIVLRRSIPMGGGGLLASLMRFDALSIVSLEQYESLGWERILRGA